MNPVYDTIGVSYADLRKPDARIARRLEAALGEAFSVLNVGAGAGAYEPPGRRVTAIEPSATMIAQRCSSAAAVVRGRAEALPFGDNAFDAAMAVLTIHHWSDQERGACEMRRVARGKLVFLTCDPGFSGFWLLDYFPGLAKLDEKAMPRMDQFKRWFGAARVTPVPIPHDCSDGFLAAYWRRPAAYLDARVRAAMSSFWAIGDVSDGLGALGADLESGAWAARYAHLLTVDEFDCGYRLVEIDP